MSRKALTLSLFILFVTACSADDRATLPFAGHIRLKPKTSIVRNIGNGVMAESTFHSLKELRDTLKKNGDVKMKAIHNPDHGGFPADRRVFEELKNVNVTCWIFAIKFEGGEDNDFHVIISNTKTGSDGIFMTAEISGLPLSGRNRAPLKKVRADFLELCKSITIPSGSFDSLHSPIKVIIHGSLFFDNHHGPNDAGPSWAKPGTSWEIHPVYGIEAGN